MNENKLLTPSETADLLGTTVSTLGSWRVQGDMRLPWIKVGNKMVRYNLADVLMFIDNQKQQGGRHDEHANL